MENRRRERLTSGDRLLLAIWACGELPAPLVGRVIGSASYAAALITRLKAENKIGCRYKDGLKGYVLHKKGREYLQMCFPEQMRYFSDGDARLQPVKSELSKRLRLHRMAYAWAAIYGFGAEVFTGEFPLGERGKYSRKVQASVLSSHGEADGSGDLYAIYYSSVLVKRKVAKEAAGSRACGVLDAGGYGFCVYHTMDSLMKWMGRTEWTFRMRTAQVLYGAGEEKRLQALILAEDMSMLERLLKSDGGIKRELFSLDDSYESYFYLPAFPAARLQYRLLTDAVLEQKLEEIIVGTVRPGEGPVYFCWRLDLWQLRRAADKICRSGAGKVFCLDYQAEVLRRCFGEEAAVLGLNPDKICALLEERLNL